MEKLDYAKDSLAHHKKKEIKSSYIFKVGDKVEDKHGNEGTVKEINKDARFPLAVKFRNDVKKYSMDGKDYLSQSPDIKLITESEEIRDLARLLDLSSTDDLVRFLKEHKLNPVKIYKAVKSGKIDFFNMVMYNPSKFPEELKEILEAGK